MRTHTPTAIFISIAAAIVFVSATYAPEEQLPYSDFDQWITRNIKESRLLGGKTKTVYAIGPEQTIDGSKPYHPLGGSPWATSNVLASPMGVVKTSNAVYPDEHPGHGKCAKMCTEIERCKAIGMVNIDVLVAGSIFLGEMVEPIKSTKNPYSKMVMGVPYASRPKAVQFDYKLSVPADAQRIYCPGFGKKKNMDGTEQAEVMLFLQRRWEDADGNLYAKRVGTGRERFSQSTSDWVEGHRTPIFYGDITRLPAYKPYMGLVAPDHSYYARNSKGKLVPVKEVGWDDADATPTHIVLMFSAASGNAYEGTPGLTFWVDNVAMV